MEITAYLASVFTATISKATPLGLAGALVVACVWAIYLLRLPNNTSRVMPRYLLLLIMGAGSAFLTIPASDLLFRLLPLMPGQTWQQDILVSLVHIGLLEEAFKLLPVLIVLALRNERKEPMDWIISGSFSALGFATLENVIYFSRSGLAIVPSRFLFTTLLHLAGTGIITAVLAWTPKKGKAAKATKFGTIGMVVTAHAAFDFFILGPVEAMAPLSIFILLALAWRFTRAVLSATSAVQNQNQHRLDHPAGNTFPLLFNSTLALLILSSIYTLQQMPPSLAAREIGTAVVIMVPVGIVIFRWLGRLTQKENHLPLKQVVATINSPPQ